MEYSGTGPEVWVVERQLRLSRVMKGNVVTLASVSADANGTEAWAFLEEVAASTVVYSGNLDLRALQDSVPSTIPATSALVRLHQEKGLKWLATFYCQC